MSEQGHSERERLRYFLDQQRQAVLAIIEGLNEAQLRTPVLPSGWTPIGLVRHQAGAESQWFQRVALGTHPLLLPGRDGRRSRARPLGRSTWVQSWLRIQAPRDFRTRQTAGRRAMTAVQMSRRHESRASNS